MSDDNKTLVRRYYEEVVNTGNVDLTERFISPEYTEVMDGKRYPAGIDGAKAHVVGVRQTYPDLHITIERQIAEGEWGFHASPYGERTRDRGLASSRPEKPLNSPA